ncbi:restriction endonuclease [Acetobacter indonesiensis]|uniref:restriction endonuclease n=1 Tax=Acetobacter indonesiensis TaxID=104101 RepID=UPI0039EC605E
MKRILFLAALVAAPGIAWAQEYRPDFNCSADHSKDSIATMLCQDSDAAKHELIFDQTYYALRQIVGRGGWKKLRSEVISDQNILRDCIEPASEPGVVPIANPECYISKIDALTEKYKSRLSGAALEEAGRDLDQHISIQKKFVDLGYLPKGTIPDGVYGESTRAAIEAWQKANDQTQSGFVSDRDVSIILDNIPQNTPSENQTKKEETQKDNPFGVLILVFVIVSGICASPIIKYIRRKQDYKYALAEITKEISNQKRNLQISRTQKLTRDQYGSLNVDGWAKEIKYFIQTRLDPIINSIITNSSDLKKMNAQAVSLIERASSEPLEVSVNTISYRSDPTVFDPRMDPFDYEQFCSLLLRSAGWNSQATQKSGDQGADVIAQKNGIKIVIQCKLYSGTVGNDAVQQAYTAKTFQGADAAMVVTNSAFSIPARQAAATTGVYLIHHTQLIDTANDILVRLTAARV